MAAISRKVDVQNITKDATIPQNDLAKVMYYLKSVTKNCGMDFLDDDLIDYRHYYLLSTERADSVFLAAYHCSPDEFANKTLFLDHRNQVCGRRTGIFVKITEATHLFAVQSEALVLGRKTSVNTILIIREDWLEQYYVRPMKNNIYRMNRALLAARASSGPSLGGLLDALIEAVSDTPKHCDHCPGKAAKCSCTKGCTLVEDSKCYPSHCQHCAGRNSACSCKNGCAPDAMSKCYGLHSLRCDLCGASSIRGSRYQCTSCADFNVCQTCYQECLNLNKHDASHAFMEYKRVGAQPTIHPAAKRALPKAASSGSTSKSPPLEAHSTATEQASSSEQEKENRQGFFYLKMSTGELKQYLRENCVSFDDVLDLETLQRRVWECYCDSVSSCELDQMLTSIGVERQTGMSIESRRTLAKQKFKGKPRSSAPTETRCPFSVGDKVSLRNLKKVGMNGKTGSVTETTSVPGRVTVRLADDGKEYRVKFENLTGVHDPEFLE